MLQLQLGKAKETNLQRGMVVGPCPLRFSSPKKDSSENLATGRPLHKKSHGRASFSASTEAFPFQDAKHSTGIQAA